MDAAAETAKQAFGKMIEEGVVDGDSIPPIQEMCLSLSNLDRHPTHYDQR